MASKSNIIKFSSQKEQQEQVDRKKYAEAMRMLFSLISKHKAEGLEIAKLFKESNCKELAVGDVLLAENSVVIGNLEIDKIKYDEVILKVVLERVKGEDILG